MDHVVIIGAYGSAGVSVAEGLIDQPDIRLTLVDDGDPGGGLCILRGCMPSKDILSAGAHIHQAETDERINGELVPDIDRIVDRKNRHVESFAAHRRAAVQEMAERPDVEFVHATARFVDDRTIEAGGKTLTADYVVAATGSTVNVPDLPGIDEVEYLTSADVLDARSFPETGIVMGLGAVGLELVPYLVTVGGVDLTVIEHDEHPLDTVHESFGRWLLEHYRETYDVEILTRTIEDALEPTADGGVRLTVTQGGETRTREAEQLYLFSGRRPALDALGLEGTEIAPVEGWLQPTLQTVADDRVFVVGDANGLEPILHIAKEQGYQTAENILAHRAGQSLDPFTFTPHHVIFSSLGIYPYVRLGVTVEEARADGHDPIVVTRQASDDGVFKVKDAPAGHARLVVAQDGTVLGYHAIHYQADTMAKTMQVIVEQDQDVRDIPDRAFHPTTPEIVDGLVRDAKVALAEQE